MADGKPIDQLNFEESISELEKIVSQLESGDTPLEDAISLYERGSQLRNRCEATLKKAEERIEKIKLDSAGTPTGSESFQTG